MFKIGDRVRVIQSYYGVLKGDEGIIKALPGDSCSKLAFSHCCAVEGPSWIKGRDCNGKVPSGHGFWVPPECLELIKPEEAKIAFERLTQEELPEFDKAMLINGRFGCTSDGDWFVVVEDRLVFTSGLYEPLVTISSEGEIGSCRVSCIVEALSFSNAKCAPKVIWKAPDFDMKKRR